MKFPSTQLSMFGLMLMTLIANPEIVEAQEVTSIDSIVALVDEDVILQTELDLAIDGIVERIQAQGGQLPPQSLLEKQVLERLVVRRLQIQRALQTGIRVSDSDIDQALTGLAQQNGLSIMQLRQVIEADGEDFGEFRQNIGEEILTERLRQRIIGSMTPISDTEVDIMLASEDFNSGEYNISHILLSLPDGANPREIAAKQEVADDIHQQLVDGLDFASAAISYSESQEALEGGEVGWRDLNSVPTAFAEAVENMRAGQYTVPIRSPAGFHIIKVNDYRDQRQVIAEEFNARHIMIETNELMNARDAMQLIRDVHGRVVDGEEFADLAKEYSDDVSSANLGGDMGWFAPEAYGDRIKVTLENLEEGQLSEPFQTQAGWHLIQLLGFRETDVTEEARRGTARQNIMQRKADIEVEQFIQEMRDEAFVEIRLPS